jgi:(1->4)-alpha-D-glucan 1-alpha-D-glucosylmutase
VDPDNRRPVDFAARQAALAENLAPSDLLKTWADGRVKQAVIARALELRLRRPMLFAKGDYVKLEAEGPAAAHVLAFARRTKTQCVVVAVTRLAAGMVTDVPLVPAEAWAETRLVLPGFDWIDALNGGTVTAEALPMTELFERLPVALLISP